jgi:osmoprotectant transport system substrate-binding protein/osmoprotectant transport system permease protein
MVRPRAWRPAPRVPRFHAACAAGLAVFAVLVSASVVDAADVIRVGSKSFTENYVVAEIAAQVLEAAGEQVERKVGLGGTGIAYRAVAHGSVDLYPEYTGTISRAILKEASIDSIEAIRAALGARGLTISGPLGFENTYALAVRADVARRLGLQRISDLVRHPELTGAFTSGFLERDDGWPGLRQHYGLALAGVRTIEHALAYQALASGAVDVIDVFSTDGRLSRADVVVLRDDRHFFPAYAAVLLARRDFVERHARGWAALERALVGRRDTGAMTRLNALADLDGRSSRQVAARFLGREVTDAEELARLARELGVLTLEHLGLVTAAVTLAVLVGLPLGILAARSAVLGQAELMAVGVLQTVPALALLCFMIPLLGIGTLPALVALFLYALLPIVRATYTGLTTLDRQLLEIADVLGLAGWRRLARIELPLASVNILAGIKTAAIWTVGTATLAAFIGGGGYGTLIVRGLALDDVRTILSGAIPAALMALLFHGLFEVVDRLLTPRGLRLVMARSGWAT